MPRMTPWARSGNHQLVDGRVVVLAPAAGALNIARHGLGTGSKEAVNLLAERVELRPISDAEDADRADDNHEQRPTGRS